MTFVLRANDQARQRVIENACEFLRRLSPAKSWRVEVAEHKERRSDAQNRFLWGIAYAQLAKATGQPAEDWHEYFLGEHYGWETVEMLGRRKLRPVRRSSRLTKAEFAEHVEFIRLNVCCAMGCRGKKSRAGWIGRKTRSTKSPSSTRYRFRAVRTCRTSARRSSVWRAKGARRAPSRRRWAVQCAVLETSCSGRKSDERRRKVVDDALRSAVD